MLANNCVNDWKLTRFLVCGCINFADAASSHPACVMQQRRENTDSLVKGMILFDQGGEGGEGEKRVMVKSAPPPSVSGLLVSACFRLFFVVVGARDCEGFFPIFSQAQKY